MSTFKRYEIPGADAIAEGERKVKELQEQIVPYRELSSSLAIQDA